MEEIKEVDVISVLATREYEVYDGLAKQYAAENSTLHFRTMNFNRTERYILRTPEEKASYLWTSLISNLNLNPLIVKRIRKSIEREMEWYGVTATFADYRVMEWNGRPTVVFDWRDGIIERTKSNEQFLKYTVIAYGKALGDRLINYLFSDKSIVIVDNTGDGTDDYALLKEMVGNADEVKIF